MKLASQAASTAAEVVTAGAEKEGPESTAPLEPSPPSRRAAAPSTQALPGALRAELPAPTPCAGPEPGAKLRRDTGWSAVPWPGMPLRAET